MIQLGCCSSEYGLNCRKQHRFTIFAPISTSYKFLSAFAATSREIQAIFVSENCSDRLLIEVWSWYEHRFGHLKHRFEPRHCLADFSGLTSTCVLVVWKLWWNWSLLVLVLVLVLKWTFIKIFHQSWKTV